ncbi:MAG: hypothetical protein ACTSWW_04525 [Promethearchaeota archaeon]
MAEMRSKIDFQRGTPQKNKALIQIVIELCKETLLEKELEKSFRVHVKKTLKEAENDLEKVKNVQESEEETQKSSMGYTPPRPLKEALTSLTAGSFDPASSPILRQLTQSKQSLSRFTTTEAAKKSEKSEVLQPFPSAEPFPSVEPPQTKSKLRQAHLEVSQLQITIDLLFQSDIQRIGRQDFAQANLPVQTSLNIFTPILPRDSEEEATEHCIIEQPSKGTFILKDRFNLQKTYFKNGFVNEEGTEIQDGDSFILPVNIDNQLSSLSVIFHVKKE